MNAVALGANHMGLYKHVPGLDALKRLVAGEIFRRWQIPQPDRDARAQGGAAGLKEYLRKG